MECGWHRYRAAQVQLAEETDETFTGTPTKLAPKLSPNKLNMIERCDLTKIIVKLVFPR